MTAYGPLHGQGNEIRCPRNLRSERRQIFEHKTSKLYHPGEFEFPISTGSGSCPKLPAGDVSECRCQEESDLPQSFHVFCCLPSSCMDDKTRLLLKLRELQFWN